MKTIDRIIDRFTNFVETRPNLYMAFLVLFIFFALGVVGHLEQEQTQIIAESK